MRLEAFDIEKWYLRGKGERNRFFAVQKTSLALSPGTVTVLTGRSGSGKTTLMSMMAGLLTPDAGKVCFDGRDLYSLEDEELSRLRNKYFGMIPQGAEVLPALSVQENILLARGIYLSETDAEYLTAKERAWDLLEKMELTGLLSVSAGELSGGERRRLCIARALAGDPQVIFADEPTSDLDDENTKTVLELLKDSAAEGAAVMIVSHDTAAMDYADVTIRMDGGILHFSGEAGRDCVLEM